MEPGAQKIYSRALDRLGAEAFSREQSRDIPYPLSLHAMAKYFWRTGTKQGWLSEIGKKRLGRASNKKPLLLAVSGGGDSVALLWMFRTLYDGPLIVAHVNHGIRGAASAGAKASPPCDCPGTRASCPSLTLVRKKVAELSPFERSLVIREAGRRLGLPTLSRRRLEELSTLIVRQKPFTFQWARGVDVLGKLGMINFKEDM